MKFSGGLRNIPGGLRIIQWLRTNFQGGCMRNFQGVLGCLGCLGGRGLTFFQEGLRIFHKGLGFFGKGLRFSSSV